MNIFFLSDNYIIFIGAKVSITFSKIEKISHLLRARKRNSFGLEPTNFFDVFVFLILLHKSKRYQSDKQFYSLIEVTNEIKYLETEMLKFIF